MRRLRPVVLLLLPLCVQAATVNFDSAGDYGNATASPNFNFSASSTPWFAEAASVGVNATRGLQLIASGGTDISNTYKGAGASLDFSTFNSTAEVSLVFKKASAATASASRVLDLGLLTDATAYLNGGTHAGVRLRSTGTQSVDIRFRSNNADAGTAVGGNLVTGNFYRLRFKMTNLDGIQIEFQAWIDDLGPSGTGPETPGIVTNNGTYSNSLMATDSSVFGGLRVRNENNSNAVAVLDNFVLTGTTGTGVKPPRAFVHPGLVNSEAEMTFWAGRANAGAAPFAAGLSRVLSGTDDAGAPFLGHVPQAVANYTAAIHWSSPGAARKLLDDARVAYACALLWRATGNASYALKSGGIIDAWSSTLQTTRNSAGQPASPSDSRQDYMLYTSYSWPAMIWAAEILRSTPGSGWGAASQTAFSNLLTNIVRPAAEHPNNDLNNNWGSWKACFRMSCAIYLEDTPRFESALEDVRSLADTYITASLRGEMGRDLWHSQMGLVPLVLASEMALKQGVDLFSHSNNLVFRTIEYQIPFCLGDLTDWPADLTYRTDTQWDGSRLWSMFEFSNHHYRNRRGLAAPRHDLMLNHIGVLVMPSIPSPYLSAPNTPRPYRAEDFYRTGYGTLTHTGDPLDYVMMAGFDLQQTLAGDQGLNVYGASANVTQVTDPTPGQARNGVLRISDPTGAPAGVARAVDLAGTVRVSFDYRFGLTGEIAVLAGNITLATLPAPASGAGRDFFAQYRATFALADFGLAPGTHTLKVELRGTGGTQAWLDNLIVTTPLPAPAAPPTYAGWRSTHFAPADPLGSPDANPDHDALNNTLEYAVNGNPLLPDAAVMPAYTTVVVAGHPHLAIRYRQRTGGTGKTGVDYHVDDLTYRVGLSTSLQPNSWQTGDAFVEPEGSPVDNGDGTETVTVRAEAPIDTLGPGAFLRLEISLDP